MIKTPFSRALAVTAALAAGLALHSPASAQDGQGRQQGGQRWEQGARQDPAQRLNQRVAMLTQRLQLNAGQVRQVRGILQQEQQQMQALRGNRGDARQQQGARGQNQGQRGQGWEQMRAVRTRSEQQIERVLNQRQLAEYRKLRQDRGQRGGGRDGGEHRPQPQRSGR